MLDFFVKRAFWLGLFVFVIWVIFGVYLFAMEPFQFSWTRGEIGDFLNGLGGIALVIIGPTALYQYSQLKEQMNQNYEEGVFRTFETLKPELENISVRIVAKAIISKTEKSSLLDGESFEDLRVRFWEYDRTVFLRIIAKAEFVEFLEGKIVEEDNDLVNAIKRFGSMMYFLDEYVEKGNYNADNSFRSALKATEVFITFKVLQNNAKLEQFLNSRA